MDFARKEETESKTSLNDFRSKTSFAMDLSGTKSETLQQMKSCEEHKNTMSATENNNDNRKMSLNFGIETILHGEKSVKNQEESSISNDVTTTVQSNIQKMNSSYLCGWYGHVLSRFPRENTRSFSSPNIDMNWSMQEAHKERFAATRRVGHPYQNRSPPKRKKPRTSFTRITVMELEKRFERQKYLASSERTTLAKTLKISDSQVKTWFQNRRTKWRRQAAEEKELERQSTNRLLLSMTSFSSKQICADVGRTSN